MNLKIRRIRKSGSSVNSNIEPVIKPKKKTVAPKKMVEKKEVVNLGALPKKELVEVNPKEVNRVEKVNIKSTSEGLRNLKMSDILIYLYEKYNGNWDAIYQAISVKERVDSDKAVRLVDSKMKDFDYTTLIDEDYPEEYKRMNKPPFVIKRKKYSDDKEY